MTPDERRALEQQAERLVRRGELSAAASVLRRLFAQFPDEPLLAERLADLEAALEPGERALHASPPRPTGEHQGPLHRAEALASEGRYAEAVALYRTLVEATPDAPLLKERLAELFALAQVAEPHRAPVNRANLLEHLLDRIGARRRS